MSQGPRQYEAIVFGATGYTGKYTAEYITTNLPTDFVWAVAGRSESKLKQVVDEIRQLNPDREQPCIEVTQLNKKELIQLAKKTKVLISTVGPYHKYGSDVVAACAETSTHYLDVTGETPWVYEMVKKYDKVAKKNGAIMISQIGVESSPADLLSWSLVQYIRKHFNTGTAEVVQSTHTLESVPSGGTLATVLSLMESYSLLHFAKSTARWSLSVVKPPRQRYSKSIWERLTGMRTVPGLKGQLTDSIQAPSDIPIVHRSWSLFDGGKMYGPNFYVSPYMRVKSALAAIAVHYGLTFGFLALLFPPVRWILKKYVYQPGQGPTKEQAAKERVEWQAIATADQPNTKQPKRVWMNFKFNGSMYLLTGMFLAEAAITISRDKTYAHELGGGILTPATLGDAFLDRLQKGGVETSIRELD